MKIILLGMHRSGTSALARLLNLMGCYLGPDELIMQGKTENPKGFWERVDIYALNEELLGALGVLWHTAAGLDITAATIPPWFEERAVQIISELDAHQPWLIKDPRFSLLLPVWRPLLGDPIVVMVHRRPLQIAQSLQARDGFPLTLGVALWEQYTLAALHASRGLPRVLVSHEQLMEKPVAVTQRLYEQLVELGVPRLQPLPRQQVEEFIDPRLFHARGDPEREQSFLNQRRKQLLRQLEDESILFEDDLWPISPDAEETLTAHGRATAPLVNPSHLQHEVARLRALQADREVALSEQWQEIQGTYQAEVDRLTELLSQSDAKCWKLGAEIEALAQRTCQLNEEKVCLDERAATSAAENAALQQRLQVLQEERSDLEQRLTSLQEEKASLEHRLGLSHANLQQREAELQAIHGSKMWRLWQRYLSMRRTLLRVFRSQPPSLC